MSLTLYYHPLAGYCWKALVALYENGTAFDKRIIDLGNPADRAELEAVWPIAKFPVIRDHARKRDVAESSIVIEYLDRHFPGARPLVPAAFDAAMDVRLWDRVFDNYVNAPMQAYVADRMRGSRGDMSAEQSMLEKAYAMIDRRMEGREWVARDGFSMADCAAVPALFYARTVHPFPAGMGNLAAYFERLMERASVKRVIDEAKPVFKWYPFEERVEGRFR